MNNYGLILEGGGMRGAYTAGVLDFFLDKDIEFKSCYGVSKGTVNALNYLSKQRGRSLHIDIDYLKDRDYASMYNLFTTGNYFGTKMCYDTIPNKLNPYDYETLKKYKGKFYAVVTNCKTGKAEYIDYLEKNANINIIRASCSLPMMAEMVKLGNDLYLDGGISDSIPIRQSVKNGNNKNVVILTRDITYRKKPNELMPLMKIKYKKYPNLIKAMEERHINYNRTLEYIENQEREGNIFVIRPKEPVKVARIEKDREKLKQLYNIGYNDAKKSYENLKIFMNDKN